MLQRPRNYPRSIQNELRRRQALRTFRFSYVMQHHSIHSADCYCYHQNDGRIAHFNINLITTMGCASAIQAERLKEQQNSTIGVSGSGEQDDNAHLSQRREVMRRILDEGYVAPPPHQTPQLKVRPD